MNKIYSIILAAVLSLCVFTSAFADDAHPWAGTYTLMKLDEGVNYHNEQAEAYGFTMVEQFTIKIEWCDTCYMVKEFLGFDLNKMDKGGIMLEVEDETYAYIPTKRYKINVYESFPEEDYYDEDSGETIHYNAYTVGLALWGQDGNSATPITLRKQSDGQIKINGFGLWLEGSTANPVCYYDACVPLNGGDPEESYNYEGYYKVTADWVMNMEEDVKWPETFVMAIENIQGYGCLTQFLGYDVMTPNWGAIYVDPDPKSSSGGLITIMDGFNVITTINGKKYYLTDYNSEAKSIKLSYNSKNDAVSIDYFNVYNYTDKTEAAYYLGCTAKKITKEEADELASSISLAESSAPASSAIYNLAGQRITSPQKGQFIIKDGKKYLVK